MARMGSYGVVWFFPIMANLVIFPILPEADMNVPNDSNHWQAIEKYYNQVAEANRDYYRHWLHEDVGTWRFWLSSILIVLPWAAWFVLRKRGSEARLLHAGMFALIVASWLDFIGVVTGRWYYGGKAIPTIPSYAPWDFCLFPVIVMLLLQYKPRVRAWIKGLAFAGATAFVGEPIFEWSGFYVPRNWHHVYSFPLYFLIYLAADRISRARSFASLR